MGNYAPFKQKTPKTNRLIRNTGSAFAGLAGLVLLNLAAPSGQTSQVPDTTPTTGILLSDIHLAPLTDPTQVDRLQTADVSKWDAILNGYPALGSDVHLSNDTRFRNDSNDVLMRSALTKASETLQQSPNGNKGIVIYTGDLLAHDINDSFCAATNNPTNKQYQTNDHYQTFVTNVAKYVIQKMQAAFKVPVIVALGNNDSLTGDYSMEPNSPLLKDLANTIAVVAQAKDPGVRTSFEKGGYYVIPNPSVPNQDLIVLNTIFLSSQYTVYTNTTGNPCAAPTRQSGPTKPGSDELCWLETQIAKSAQAGHTVCLVMHIPPGIDAFASSPRPHAPPSTTPGVLLWREEFNTRFLGILSKHRGTVSTSFAGHTHMDDFRIVSDLSAEPNEPFLPRVVIRTTPSVSPYFYNNPAFSRFLYDSGTGTVGDVQTFYLPLASTVPTPTWQEEPWFLKAYPSCKAYNATALYDLSDSIKKSKAMDTPYTTYATMYDAYAPNSPVDSTSYVYYACAQTNLTKTAYDACVAGVTKK